ncbi:radical SAM/SPASM domain-containing protein [Sphingomonas kyeonggiensis]|uniref:Radical SAM core domain-containing protein n=1 Tax=Sphingomonas kyeonggiensis TaxID=1268553 RepID=A0A7W6JNU1_9SPHN|nr:radical SAM/SPASM domain-containing protein [Sphingomonas kyeonggiensis]MBB4096810.1 hypothetical protein [Sphingomonas kyeonggiensis]
MRLSASSLDAAAVHVQNPLKTLVLNVTLQCPLRCAHCCFSSDMFQGGCLSAADVALAITQAAQSPTLEIVCFVGGDPLLHPMLVADGIALAASLGLKTSITTSAFWAKSAEKARAVLAPLRAAGLTDLVISYDDAHAAFVREAYIANALAEARALDIVVRIAVVVETGSKITAASLRTSLGLDDVPSVKVYQTIANSTGRAAEHRNGEDPGTPIHPDAYRGPCQSILNTVEIDSEGGVRPCCGVLPHHDALRVGHIHGQGIVPAMQDAAADPLFRWISLEGPISILAKVTADDPEPIRAETFDGICTACDRLFGNPDLLDRVRAAAEQRRDWLDRTEMLLQRISLASDSAAA